MSVSGGILPELQYRFSSKFSVSVGALLFFGREETVDMPVNDIAAGFDRTGNGAYKNSVENGLAVIRDRDEIFMRLRYSF